MMSLLRNKGTYQLGDGHGRVTEARMVVMSAMSLLNLVPDGRGVDCVQGTDTATRYFPQVMRAMDGIPSWKQCIVFFT